MNKEFLKMLKHAWKTTYTEKERSVYRKSFKQLLEDIKRREDRNMALIDIYRKGFDTTHYGDSKPLIAISHPTSWQQFKKYQKEAFDCLWRSIINYLDIDKGKEPYKD